MRAMAPVKTKKKTAKKAWSAIDPTLIRQARA